MSNGEIDRLQVNQLIERYDLARSAVYKRLEALSIKTEKIGNKAYINAEQLRLLDELHQFIQSGGNTAEFLEMRGIQKVEESPELSLGLSTLQPNDLVQLVAAIAAEVASRSQPPTSEPDFLVYFEKLENAYRNGWLLSTLEVAELLNLSPSEIREYGDRFSEAGFTFTREGFRAGGEVAWRVSKPIK